jgi:hypothetical protein
MTLLLNFEMILASNKATLVHKDYLFLEMEQKQCLNNQVSNTGSGEPLVRK